MDWDDLRVFLAISRHGTFAGAGREIGVNATTIGRRLTALEEDVGSLLFARTSDGLVRTAAGDSIAEAAEVMERQARLIEKTVGGEAAKLEGLVRVALSDNLASCFMSDHLGAFRRRHPGVQIELNTGDAIVDLARGDADLALRFRSVGGGPGDAPQRHVEIRAKRVTRVGIGVFASRGYLEQRGTPCDAHSVDGHDVIMPRAEAMYLPGSSWVAEVRDRVRCALTSDSLASMAAAAEAGFGLVALPSFVAWQHPLLVPIEPPSSIDGRDMWLLMPSDLRRVARVRALWDYLVELLNAWEPLLSGAQRPYSAQTPPNNTE